MTQGRFLSDHLHECSDFGLLWAFEVVGAGTEDAHQYLNRIFAAKISTDRQGIVGVCAGQLFSQLLGFMFEQRVHLLCPSILHPLPDLSLTRTKSKVGLKKIDNKYY